MKHVLVGVMAGLVALIAILFGIIVIWMLNMLVLAGPVPVSLFVVVIVTGIIVAFIDWRTEEKP